MSLLAASHPPPFSPLSQPFLGAHWDSRDLSSGAVASWASRDSVPQTLTEATNQPTKGATGVVFNGTTHKLTRTTAQVKYIGATLLPDGAAGATASKGFTCTGLCRLPDGTWFVGNHGKALPANATFTPSLVHLSSDFTTLLADIPLAALYSGIGSVQGVTYDSSDGTLWFADLANKKIRHITTAGVPITGDEITLTYTPNGCCYVDDRDSLWINTEENDPLPDVVELWSCATGTRTSTQNLGITNHDQLTYNAATKTVLLSAGANGTAGSIRIFDASTTTLRQITTFTLSSDADAIEGIHWQGNKLFIVNDGYFHTGSPALNRALEYTVTPLAATIFDFWFCGIVAATTGTDCIFALGDPLTAATRGIGLYPASTTELRVFANTGGTGTTEQASALGTSCPILTSARVVYGRVDTVADTITLWVDGTQLVQSSAAVLTGALTGDPNFRMGTDASSRFMNGTIKALGYCWGDGKRQKMEGYLAQAFALTANLPADHPYKTIAP